MRAQLIVKSKACIFLAQLNCLFLKLKLALSRRIYCLSCYSINSFLGVVFIGWNCNAHGLRHVNGSLQMHGFMEHDEAVEVQRVIAIASLSQQIQSLLQGCGKVGFAGDML